MAKYIFAGAGVTSVTYNSVDISDHVESIEVSMEIEDVDLTAMGNAARVHGPGLRNDKITLNLFQNFAAGKIHQTVYPLVGSSSGAAMVIKPTTSSVSTVNPSFTATVAPFSYSPLAGSVGDASQTSIEFLCCDGSSIVVATT